MASIQRIHSVLIVTGSQRDAEFITPMLAPSSYQPVTTAGSVNEAQRILINSQFDIVIIDTPLPDSYGHDFAVDLSANTSSGIMLLVKSEAFDIVAGKVSRYGVLTVAKPVTKQFFFQTLTLISATRERLRALEKKNIGLRDTIEEIRLVNRAKWVLIERLGMNETQAHKHIERMAMDTRRAKREVAEDIIKTHEAV